MNTVNLYEDNAGGLYINIEGSETVYRIRHPELTTFSEDAHNLLRGEEWQGMDTAPLSDIEAESPLACYDGELNVFATPGNNGQIYLYGK